MSLWTDVHQWDNEGAHYAFQCSPSWECYDPDAAMDRLLWELTQ